VYWPLFFSLSSLVLDPSNSLVVVTSPIPTLAAPHVLQMRLATTANVKRKQIQINATLHVVQTKNAKLESARKKPLPTPLPDRFRTLFSPPVCAFLAIPIFI
jgi:hypothetical protein